MAIRSRPAKTHELGDPDKILLLKLNSGMAYVSVVEPLNDSMYKVLVHNILRGNIGASKDETLEVQDNLLEVVTEFV